MPFVEVGASQICYDSYGEGQPIVFAHGLGGNRVSWFRQVPHFSARFRTIVFDHRAFGKSTDAEGEGRSRYIDDLLALLDALEIDRAILVGQSMGGGTCAAFACRYPDRVKALVVADSLTGVEVPDPLASELAALRAANQNLSQVERVLGPTTRARDPESTLLYLQLASFNSVNLRTIRGTTASWSPAALGATGVPTMFIAGEQDILFTPDQIRRTQEMVDGSQFALIEEAGHSAYFDQPQRFSAVLDAVLDGVNA